MHAHPLPTRHTPSQQGFTLIELSIVLIIIGLVMGGIMSGRSILEAAENRAIYTDAETYITSISQFVDKYENLPGDMYDAEDVWGQAAAAAACATTNNSNKTTCSGDGDSQIELGTTTVVATGIDTVEHLRAWHQLSNAGLIQGNFSGVPGSAGNPDHAIPGTNVPAGTVGGSGYTLYYKGSDGGNFFDLNDDEVYGHILNFGLYTATNITDAPALLPQEAWEVDAKTDDGIPHSGNVRTYTATAHPNCASADTLAAIYSVTYTDGRTCNLVFLTGF